MRAPEMTRREVIVAAVGASLLAIAMTWPLLINLGSVVPRDIGDPLAEAWQPAWGGHALIHQPLHFFDANRFWPLRDSLAFGDALIGYAQTGIIGTGPHAAMVRYDLLFLFAYALAFFGAYLLAREVGLSPAGAAIAGAAFAFAPYRLEQDGHLQVLHRDDPVGLLLVLLEARHQCGLLVEEAAPLGAVLVDLGVRLEALVAQVDQHDLDLPAVVGVDQTGPVHDAQAVARGQPRARYHEARHPVG